METIVINDSKTELYAGGGKWLTQSEATCYREFHRRVLVTSPMKAEAWTEWTDAQKRAWEGNPPRALDRDNPADALLIRRWEEACIRYYKEFYFARDGGFNPRTGYCEYPPLYDLTGDDVISILEAGRPSGQDLHGFSKENTRARVALPTADMAASTSYAYYYWKSVEVVNAANLNYGAGLQYLGCPKLHTILNAVGHGSAYSKIPSLVDITFGTLAEKMSFAESPLLSLKSLRGIEAQVKAGDTKSYLLTVHADVYAKLTGDTTNGAAAALTPEELARWTQLLADAAEKNITFTKP